MLYDLNIPWTPATPPTELARTLAFSRALGYDVVALNYTLPSSATSSAPPPPPPRFPSPPSSSSSTSPSPPKILRRATILLGDPSASSLRASALAPHYDVLAVRPTTAAAFQTACVGLQDVPLISLNLCTHLGFPIRPRPAMAAVSRGVRFEVSYAQFLAPAADARVRANFISNLSNLVRATAGRGIVLSSGGDAASPAALRAPADVVNLVAVWGLAQERGRQALGAVPRSIVANEAIKRSGFRGVVDIVQAADEGGGAGRKRRAEEEEEGEQEESGGQKKKNTKGGAEGSAETGAAPPPPMSKRQAKRQRLLAEGKAS